MLNRVDAIIIAIGTELSSGQIINSNAAWISQQLTEAGLENILHWTLPDHDALIEQTLQAAQAQSSLVFVTGGLGPTSDDFTRIVVARFLGQKLVFHDSSWQRLEERARHYGFRLGESQKQQCWFPEQAEVFPNLAGTADAFVCQQNDLHLIVLPGPPHEIKSLWQSSVADYIKPLMPAKAPVTLYRWQCLGIGEGTLGEIVEATLQGQEGITTGYRAHAPYIEVKLWIEQDQNAQDILALLEPAIKQWVVLRNDEDAAQHLIQALPATQVCLVDACTRGLFVQRLSDLIPQEPVFELEIHSLWPTSNPEQSKQRLSELSDTSCTLFVGPLHEHHWELALYWPARGIKYQQTLELPWKGPLSRSLFYVRESSLMTWTHWLKEAEVQA